ncbi:hypothetical protein D6_0027 [Aeromonas phage D6]|uniref:Uncharacterized protein n=1 Tax=Aeromonas phage D6 TaxID=2593322 RepID=A0A7G7XLJ1_9CAUD|nr:hypothetical protein PQC08_gp248 [Aeromonas phage D6]QNH80836.1 hypothetical protein D6_0027 [Aeromonas phage D6]
MLVAFGEQMFPNYLLESIRQFVEVILSMEFRENDTSGDVELMNRTTVDTQFESRQYLVTLFGVRSIGPNMRLMTTQEFVPCMDGYLGRSTTEVQSDTGDTFDLVLANLVYDFPQYFLNLLQCVGFGRWELFGHCYT